MTLNAFWDFKVPLCGLLGPLVISCTYNRVCVDNLYTNTHTHTILPPESAHKISNCSHALHHHGAVFSCARNSLEKTFEHNNNLPLYCPEIAASHWTHSVQHRALRRLWGIDRQLVSMIYDRSNKTSWWLQQNWFQSALFVLFFFKMCVSCLSFFLFWQTTMVDTRTSFSKVMTEVFYCPELRNMNVNQFIISDLQPHDNCGPASRIQSLRVNLGVMHDEKLYFWISTVPSFCYSCFIWWASEKSKWALSMLWRVFHYVFKEYIDILGYFFAVFCS